MHELPEPTCRSASLPLLAAAAALTFSACASSSESASTTTSAPSARPPILMTTSCKIGNYLFPTEDGNGPNSPFAGEKVSVTDNWPKKSSVEVINFVAVFYDHGKEVGSVLATGNGDTESTSGASAYINALIPASVILTLQQSQTWTLPAGWTGNATSCRVVKLITSPPVSQNQVGLSG